MTSRKEVLAKKIQDGDNRVAKISLRNLRTLQPAFKKATKKLFGSQRVDLSRKRAIRKK